MAMVTFKPPKAEKSKARGSLAMPTAGEDHTPPPTVYLEHEHLKQLGLKKLPAVGSKIHFHAVAHVGSTSEDQDRGDGGGGPRRSMRLHIHQMDMGDGEQSTGEKDEDQAAGAKAEMDKALSRQEGSESGKPGPAGGKKRQKGG
jgi:hypothetical protein